MSVSWRSDTAGAVAAAAVLRAALPAPRTKEDVRAHIQRHGGTRQFYVEMVLPLVSLTDAAFAEVQKSSQ